MRSLTTSLPDLFAPRRRIRELSPAQRSTAVKLLEALLKEAMATPVSEGEASAGQEVRDDQDHR